MGARARKDDPTLTPEGAARSDECQADFSRLLGTLAAISAKRRGAKGVDNADVDGAYQSLISPRQRPRSLDVLAEVFLVVGGIAVGYSITLVGQLHAVPGVVLCGIGLIVLIGGAVLKNVSLR